MMRLQNMREKMRNNKSNSNNRSKEIFVVTKTEEDLLAGELDAGIIGPGWYFWDETWCNAHGPFDTIEICEEIYKQYIYMLNENKEESNI